MNPAPLETEKELALVKEIVLLPILLDVLERDMKTLNTIPLKMPAIYMKSLRRVQDQVSIEMVVVRRRLRERGIKVYQQKRTQLQVEAAYLCRGSHHQFSMLWGLVKSEIERKLSHYLNVDLANDEAPR